MLVTTGGYLRPKNSLDSDIARCGKPVCSSHGNQQQEQRARRHGQVHHPDETREFQRGPPFSERFKVSDFRDAGASNLVSKNPFYIRWDILTFAASLRRPWPG